MPAGQSQSLSHGIVASVQKVRQNIKETKQKITQLKLFQNPRLINKIKQLQEEIHKLSFSTIENLSVQQEIQKSQGKNQVYSQQQYDQISNEFVINGADQKQLEILQNIVKNKFNEDRNRKIKNGSIIEQKHNLETSEVTMHKQFLRFLDQEPQKLIEQRLVLIRQKYVQSFSDKKYSQLNKYLSHKKSLYEKLASLKPGTNLYTSHQRVLLKQYLDWFRKWNQELTQKIQKKSNVHQQFLQAKNVYLNSCKKLATLILQQRRHEENLENQQKNQ